MSFRFCKKKRVFAYVMSNLKLLMIELVIILALTLALTLTLTSWFSKLIIDRTETITAFKQKVNVDQAFVVDRLEGNYAVCQDMEGVIFNCKINDFPKGIKEGDVINRIHGKYVINKEDTLANKKKIEETADKLWN